MKRRLLLQTPIALSAALVPGLARAQDKWGASQGYPTGWSGGLIRDPAYRVGNYSGGFENMLPHRVVQASSLPLPFNASYRDDFKYRWGFFAKSVDEYLNQWPVTGLLICRGQDILIEKYRYARTSSMRLTSWSMAKSVTSLLLGICLDRGLIDSYDDLAAKYVPELGTTLHGTTTLRNLSNMSSGAEIRHDRDNATIYPGAFTTKTSSILRTVANWNLRREDQGLTYNYNELCPLTLGIVIRRVAGVSMSEFARTHLWEPLGAEANATWTTDSENNEFNCVGFAAVLRDWARLGNLIANRGRVENRQVVSGAWITECTTWRTLDKQVRHGVAMRDRGYKAHFWHEKPDGSRPIFHGLHGQRVIVDMPTKTVLVHTALEQEGHWEAELSELFNAASIV